MVFDVVNRMSGIEFLALVAMILSFSGFTLVFTLRQVGNWLPKAALAFGLTGTFVLSVSVFAAELLPMDNALKLAALCLMLIPASFYQFSGSHLIRLFRSAVLLLGYGALVELAVFQTILPGQVSLPVSAAVSFGGVAALGLVGYAMLLAAHRHQKPQAESDEDDKERTVAARPVRAERLTEETASSISDSRPPTTQPQVRQVAAVVSVPTAPVYSEPKGIKKGSVKVGSQLMLITRTEDNQWAEFVSAGRNYWVATSQLKIVGHFKTLPTVEFSS